jgi:hypothetical protein
VKRVFWCSIEIAYRDGAAIFRSDVGRARHFHPDASKFLQQMSTTNTKKVWRQTGYHSFFIMKKKSWVNISASTRELRDLIQTL